MEHVKQICDQRLQ